MTPAAEALRARNLEAHLATWGAVPTAGFDARFFGEPDDGPLTLLVRLSENSAGLPLHSRRDPVSEARRWLGSEDDVAAGRLVVVVGAGLGYVVEAAVARDPQAVVLVVEPLPGAAAWMLSRRDWTEQIRTRRLMVLEGPVFEGAPDAWRIADGRTDRPLLIVNPVLQRASAEAVREALELAKRLINGARQNEAARRAFAGPYLLNTLRNLPVIAREGDVAALEDAFLGTPAIVVAAGPSLDATLPAVREVAEHALVVAVGTAVRPLVAAGVVPHVVVSVDPTPTNAQNLAALPRASEMWFLGEGSLAPTVFPQFAGRSFVFRVGDHEPWPWLDGFGLGRGLLRAWGSVLVTAFDAAVSFGCDPLIIVGADLAFTKGQPYCRNTTYEAWWKQALDAGWSMDEIWAAWRKTRQLCVEPDIHGEPVETAEHFLAFRDGVRSAVAATRRRRVINATGAGILHGPGIEQGRVLDAVRRPVGIAPARELARRHGRRGTSPAVSVSHLAQALEGGESPDPARGWLEVVGSGGATPERGRELLVEALREAARGLGQPPA